MQRHHTQDTSTATCTRRHTLRQRRLQSSRPRTHVRTHAQPRLVAQCTSGSSSHQHTRPRSVSQSLHKAHTMCARQAATAHTQPHYQSRRVARCRHMAATSVCECDTTRRRRQRWGHVTPRRDTQHTTGTAARDTAPPHTTTQYSTQSHPAAHREQGQCTPQRHSGCTPHTPAYHSLQRCDAITATATRHGTQRHVSRRLTR